ncbi:MAG: cysteine desulfurase [Acidobacteria bacterium]|nr:cysteine desulfurase [Acidobacteriota bacterium]
MEPKKPIYLDYHATTPVDPRVLEAMLPYFTEVFGNPASKNHTYGNDAFKAVEDSRETLAKAIKARPQEIVFTSGATESINLAIKGTALANRHRGKHFITVATEHKAVLDCFEWLMANGFETTILPVDSEGLLDPAQVADAIRPDTLLVSVMAANNEIGVIQPLEEIGKICRARSVYFMTDATQALGKIPLDVQRLNVDLLAASGHKVYGPKGVGFLYVRRSNPRVALDPIIHGGGHEKGLRSGTLATPNIVGLAKAVDISIKEMVKEQKRLGELRDQLMHALLAAIPDAKVNGSLNHRLAGNLNITFPGVESEALMIALRSAIAVSSGSACTTAAVLPSHVLKAIGLSDAQSHSAIRFGLGRFTEPKDIPFIQALITQHITRLRQLSQT